MKSQPPDDETEALSEEKLTWDQRTSLRAIRHLYNLTKKNSSQRQASTSAFNALILVRGFWNSYAPPGERPDAEHSDYDEIPVPRWIVDILVHVWARYIEAPARTSLGEVFGLQGGGQGKRPANREIVKDLRDLQLAISVAELRNQHSQKTRHKVHGWPCPCDAASFTPSTWSARTSRFLTVEAYHRRPPGSLSSSGPGSFLLGSIWVP